MVEMFIFLWLWKSVFKAHSNAQLPFNHYFRIFKKQILTWSENDGKRPTSWSLFFGDLLWLEKDTDDPHGTHNCESSPALFCGIKKRWIMTQTKGEEDFWYVKCTHNKTHVIIFTHYLLGFDLRGYQITDFG